MSIEHWNTEKDGDLCELAMRQKFEARGYSVSRYIYPPGTTFLEHKHNVDKIDGVLAGRFSMVMLGEKLVLGAGDCLVVPKGVIHSAEVVGDEPVVSLDAVKFQDK